MLLHLTEKQNKTKQQLHLTPSGGFKGPAVSAATDRGPPETGPPSKEKKRKEKKRKEKKRKEKKRKEKKRKEKKRKQKKRKQNKTKKKRQEKTRKDKKRKRMEKEKEKLCNQLSQSLFLSFYFATHFLKPLKFVLGPPKWKLYAGKKRH